RVSDFAPPGGCFSSKSDSAARLMRQSCPNRGLGRPKHTGWLRRRVLRCFYASDGPVRGSEVAMWCWPLSDRITMVFAALRESGLTDIVAKARIRPTSRVDGCLLIEAKLTYCSSAQHSRWR